MSPSTARRIEPPASITSTRPWPGSATRSRTRELSSKHLIVAIGPAKRDLAAVVAEQGLADLQLGCEAIAQVGSLEFHAHAPAPGYSPGAGVSMQRGAARYFVSLPSMRDRSESLFGSLRMPLSDSWTSRASSSNSSARLFFSIGGSVCACRCCRTCLLLGRGALLVSGRPTSPRSSAPCASVPPCASRSRSC